MKKALYLECASGISGDMFVAAMLDLGVSPDKLKQSLAALKVEGYSLEIKNVMKNGIKCCDFNVILAENEPHHHHHHDHEEKPEHEEQHHHHHHHEHRNLADVFAVIDHGDLSLKVKDLAKKIFMIVAQAEAQAHNLPLNEVHFHEVGAIDSIVDIVGAAICMEEIGIEEVIVESLAEGSGTVKCQHGILNVPVPAVVNIVVTHAIPLKSTRCSGELVTPTGAAVAAALRTQNQLPEKYQIVKIGCGAGKKTFDNMANFLRVMQIEWEDDVKNSDGVWVLECNIDDCPGEVLGFTMEQLFAGGALDVLFIPVYMKKNRPGQILQIIAKTEDVEKLEAVVFSQTTTIGIRKSYWERSVMERQIIDFPSSLGVCRVKKCTYQHRQLFYPEYESVKNLAQKNQLPYIEIYRRIQNELAVRKD